VREKPYIKHFAKRSVCALALAVGLGCSFAGFSARAEDAPFEFEAGRWMSSQSYINALRRHPLEDPIKKEPTLPPVSEAPSPAPVVAKLPPAPFLPPTMPGLNKGFNVVVDSAEDVEEPKAHTSAPNAPKDIQLSEKNWMTPSAKKALIKEQDDEDRDSPPLKVRMTFLPAQSADPSPGPEKESALKKARALLRKNAEDKKRDQAKAEQEASDLAALDAFKKQQLDAIQSDRETLKALQDAIHSLGLAKQMSFMAGQGSKLNTPPENQTPDTASASPETSVR
jgi:hypothetical protein